jgi:hypothetical protein
MHIIDTHDLAMTCWRPLTCGPQAVFVVVGMGAAAVCTTESKDGTMAGQWAPDPYGRAELRYFDGQTWTDQVSNKGVTSVDGPQPGYPMQGGPNAYQPQVAFAGTTGGTSGKLIAAGVMTLLEAGILLLVGLWLLSVSTSDVGGFVDDVSGGAITFAALLVLAMGGGLLAAGVGSCKGLNWGRMMVIVLHGIGLALLVIGLLGSAGDSGSSDFTTDSSDYGFGYTTTSSESSESSPADFLVPVAWSGTIIFLAWTGKTKEQQLQEAQAAQAAYRPPNT